MNYEPWIFVIWTRAIEHQRLKNYFHLIIAGGPSSICKFVAMGAYFSYIHTEVVFCVVCRASDTLAIFAMLCYNSIFSQCEKYTRVFSDCEIDLWEKSHIYGCNTLAFLHELWVIYFATKKRRWRNLILRGLGNKSCHASVLVWFILGAFSPKDVPINHAH